MTARGRPPKPSGSRKSKDLRIPVSPSEKELVAEAASLAGQDMASWARPILLREAWAAVAKSLEEDKS